MPAKVQLKKERDTKLAAAKVKAAADRKAEVASLKKQWLERGEAHWNAHVAREQAVIEKTRAAKREGNVYVPAESEIILVIRIKGINALPPKPKKILQLLRLRQINNAVFLKNNKAIMNMLRVVEPWVTYGTPSRQAVSELIYKRGYGKVNKARIRLDSNFTIQESLGEKGIICVEDLINEIVTCGPNFKAANNFLWPFKLTNAVNGYDMKRRSFLNNGEVGFRANYINALVRKML